MLKTQALLALECPLALSSSKSDLLLAVGEVPASTRLSKPSLMVFLNPSSLKQAGVRCDSPPTPPPAPGAASLQSVFSSASPL